MKNNSFRKHVFLIQENASGAPMGAKHGDVEPGGAPKRFINLITTGMKKILTIIAALATLSATAQSIAGSYIDINNIKARVNADGSLFTDFTNGQFEVPKGSGKGTIFTDALWIGGYDAGMQLKVAAQTYRQNGTDFWPGPLSSTGMADSTLNAPMNRVWKLNKCDIDLYHNWCMGGSVGVSPVDSTTAWNIVNWPVVSPYGDALAPYFDMNVDGHYDPAACDYPLIKGDQALFFVYNDKQGIHTESGGAALGVEIQVMAYAYNCPDSALQNTVFVNYKVVNKSAFQLHDLFIGKWTDLDIGNYGDDFVGCDVSRGMYYGYNGDGNDAGSGGYGTHPGAQAVVFLKGPLADVNGMDDMIDSTVSGSGFNDMIVDNERLGMSRFMYYQNNTNPVNGNPMNAQGYYNYTSGKWLNNTNWTYGGNGTGAGPRAYYMFPGTSDPMGFGTAGVVMPPWSEITAGNIPGDRRAVASTGPFSVQQGAVQEIEVAYIFGRDYVTAGNLASVDVMNERVDSIRAAYPSGIPACGCAASVGINEHNTPASELFVYPNPASDLLYVQYTAQSKNAAFEIYDATGHLVKQGRASQTIDVTGLSQGLYVLKISDNGKVISKKFLKR